MSGFVSDILFSRYDQKKQKQRVPRLCRDRGNVTRWGMRNFQICAVYFVISNQSQLRSFYGVAHPYNKNFSTVPGNQNCAGLQPHKTAQIDHFQLFWVKFYRF